MRLSLFPPALVAALIGYGSSIAIVIAALQAVGASPAQMQSALFAVCLAKAFGALVLSSWTRIPIILSWTTPGAALIAASQSLSISEAVGAFILTGILIALTGLITPLSRLVARIPETVAAAMLAGVLLPFCLNLAPALSSTPMLAGGMIGVFFLIRIKWPNYAVLAALLFGVIASIGLHYLHLPLPKFEWPRLTFISPSFSLSALFGMALPLYLVTMAAQNLPGFTIQRAAGYAPEIKKSLVLTGSLSALTGFFGAITHNMAAITAAICLDPASHPNRDERWKVAIPYALCWTALALSGPWLLGILTQLPPAFMQTLVALGLLGPVASALANSMRQEDQRLAAAITIVVAASGVSFFGVAAPFWGLLAGLAVYTLDRIAAKA